MGCDVLCQLNVGLRAPRVVPLKLLQGQVHSDLARYHLMQRIASGRGQSEVTSQQEETPGRNA